MLKELGDLKDPKLNELREDFLWAVDQRDTNIYRRQRLNYDARYCVWNNQSDDGRKWNPRRGEDQVFPWNGASDARVPLVDLYCNKDVAMLNVLTARMPIVVRPTEINDAKWATTSTTFLRWMIYEQMAEWHVEQRLLASILLERGVAVMGTLWHRQEQMGYESIDLESIIARVQHELQSNPQADRRLQDLPHMLLNPAFDDETVKLAAEFYPRVPLPRLKRVVADLRKDGFAKFPNPYLLVNRPRVRAYSPNEDIFLPPEMTCMDDARNVHVRELLTEAKLRDRAQSWGWDEEFIAQMIETQRGKITYGEDYLGSRSRLLGSRLMQNYEKLFEVIHSYRRLADEEGVPAIYYTCWNVNMTRGMGNMDKDLFAYHDLLNYDHGELPLTLFEREKRSRRVDDSRGYGEVASTWQNQVKAEWDGRIDRASIATLPPSYYPDGQQPDKWGPGVQIPTTRPDAYGFLKPPEFDQGSKEAEATVREFADEYFGQSKLEPDAAINKLMKQDLADIWMRGQRNVVGQVFGLRQQFMPDEFYFAVTQQQQSRTIHATRDQIQGKFTVGISFDVTNLDAEAAEKKIGQIEELDEHGRERHD